MKRIHGISGLILSLFIGLHLFNHLLSLYGAERHIACMDQLRVLYRNPIGETVLLLAVLIQVFSGLNIFFRQRKQQRKGFEKLQVATGLYMAFFLFIHVAAILAGRVYFQLDTNFYFGAAGLNTFPVNLFFIPYYVLAIMAFFGHLAAIHFRKMKSTLFGIQVKQQSQIIVVLGLLVSLCIVYGFTNGFQGVHIPAEYNPIIGK